VPQFAYHLHVDPRLRIRSVTVREDDADRLLRWSQISDTVVLFLNDRATRAQTVRVEALLPLTPPQEIELPRIRIAGAIPGPERVTVFHDAGVIVRIANPEDFPLAPPADPGSGANGDRLVARLDILPEQSNPRVHVERVLPQVTSQTATVREPDGGAWRMTTCVAFHVGTGRIPQFVVDLPESLASVIEARTIPGSWTSRQSTAGGRMALTFHADDPALRDFRVLLSGPADVSRADWQLPDVRTPGAESVATLLVFPRGAFDAVTGSAAGDAVVIPQWLSEVIPSASSTAPWDSYHWPGGTAVPTFRPTRELSERPLASPARLELWINRDGTTEGSLSLNISGSLPPSIEFDWPEPARPSGLFIDGEFRPLPVPANGACLVSLPAAMSDRMVWLSWTDSGSTLPALAGPFSAYIPWPRQIPVENLRVSLHPPRHYRVDIAVPFGATREDAPTSFGPPVLFSNLENEAAPSGAVALIAAPALEPGKPFAAGASLKLVNQRPPEIGQALAVALLAALVCWRILPVWTWLIGNETVCWLALAAFWWLCLSPSWLGPIIGLWACMKAYRRQRTAIIADPHASTAHAPPVA